MEKYYMKSLAFALPSPLEGEGDFCQFCRSQTTHGGVSSLWTCIQNPRGGLLARDSANAPIMGVSYAAVFSVTTQGTLRDDT